MTTSPDCNDDRDYEEYLHQKSKDQNAMLIDVVHKLSSALVYPECSNSETNEKLWNLYAQQWKPDAPWVIKMGQDKTQSPGTAYQCVGEEWSEKKDLQYIIETFIDPYVNSSSSHVGEIGSGGGRVAHQVYPRVKSLMCFDISQSMLDQARSYLDKAPNVTFHHLTTGSGFPSEVYGTFDFIYSFDVFVHLDLHTIWQYFQELYKLLKVNGQAFISTANVMSPLGWARFSKQQKYSVGGFYFVSPEIINHFIQQSGLRLIKSNNANPSQQTEKEKDNMYFQRDYLVIVEKPAANGCHLATIPMKT